MQTSSHLFSSLVERGQQEIALARQEMPGLMLVLEKLREAQPLAGARIAGCLHMTVQTAVFIQVLIDLGAQVQWTSCNVLSTQDRAAAACQAQGIPIFSWKGMTDVEYAHSLRQVVDIEGESPHLIVDDGGDLTEDVLQRRPAWLSSLRGLTEQTTSGMRRLEQKARAGLLSFPCFNVNGSVTKRKFDNLYGCRESLLDGIRRATDLMIAGKKAVVIGYGDVGKGCAQAFAGAKARVIVVEVDPICALQASMEGFSVRTLEEAAPSGDFFVTATGCKDVIRQEHLAQMKEGALLCNIGHFNVEIDREALCNEQEWRRVVLQPEVEQFVSLRTGKSLLLLAQGRLVNLACATGHPSFVMSLSFTNQLFALLELWNHPKKYSPGIHRLPKKLDEEVARLHLQSLDAHLSVLTEEQRQYLDLGPDGTFKKDDYLY